MRKKHLITAALMVAAGFSLSACVEDGYGYGLGGGYGSGYYGDYYNDFYDGGYGTPYYGWQDGYYYPGTGYYVYDRDRRPQRWNNNQRDYWQKRGHGWKGPRSQDEWRGFQRGPRQDGSDGYRWGNRGEGRGDRNDGRDRRR